MNSYVIYCHTNKINGKKYVGQTCMETEKRWRSGFGYRGVPFFNAIQKYGWENFSHEILEKNLTSEQANQREIYWISFFNSNHKDYGYNATPGGNNYMSEMWKDDQYRKKMIESFKIARKKTWSDPQVAAKLQARLQEGVQKFWNDPEKRSKRIQNIVGDKNPNAKKVQCIQTGQIFTTIKEASAWAGLKAVSGIGQCCKGLQKTSGKHPQTGESLHWGYVQKGGG